MKYTQICYLHQTPHQSIKLPFTNGEVIKKISFLECHSEQNNYGINSNEPSLIFSICGFDTNYYLGADRNSDFQFTASVPLNSVGSFAWSRPSYMHFDDFHDPSRSWFTNELHIDILKDDGSKLPITEWNLSMFHVKLLVGYD